MRNALLFVLLIKVIAAGAQDDVIFTRYSHYDGLPSVFNNTQLNIDQAGFLWIYSEQGFTRYDGYNFKIYPFNNASLWGKTIPTGSLPDQGGFERFYFAADLDVYVYNPLKNGFDRYDFSKLISGDKNQIVRVIDDTKNHCLWINSKENLFRLKYFTGEIKKYSAPPPARYWHLIPGNEIVYNSRNDSVIIFNITSEKFRTAYLKDARDITYFLDAEYLSSNNNGGKGELISKVILSKDLKTFYWFNSQSSSSPKVIQLDSPLGVLLSERYVMTLTDADNLWISMGARLLHLDFRTEKMDSMDIKVRGNTSRSFQATGIIRDGDNELWIAFLNYGLVRVNTSTKKVTQYLSVTDNPNSLWSNDVFCLAYHNSGVLWAAQNSYGLVKIEKRKNIFSTISPVASELSSLRDYFQITNTRMCFPLDSDHLLAGTFASLTDVNIRTGKAEVVRYHDNSVVKELTAYHLYGCAASDKQGNIFIGTWDNYLFVFNPSSKMCRSFYNLPGGPSLKDYGQAYRAMLIDSGGMLWLGSRDGLFRISTNELLSNPSPRLEAVKRNAADTGAWKITFAFLEDRSKNVWVGSISGVKVFSPDGKVTAYVHEEGKNSLSINEVRCFTEDKDGNIWIGTFGGGLNKFDIKTHQFTVYTTQDGLPDDVIYTMLFDKEGNLWLTTNRGLCKFNPMNKAVTNFSPFDGLQGYEFNTNAFCKMPGGELVFGGTSGINVFKPEDIAVSAPVPNVILSSFKVLGEEASLDSDVIRLSYTQDNLSFQFATTSYYRSSENQFAYQLDALDHDWVYSGNRAYVTYSHVPPGDYTFRVKAANSSGIWNEKGVAYKISVSPPWWETWWFQIAAVFSLAAAIYFLYRYQLKQALKLQTIRNRIAGDLHDEIGSTLSSISIYSQVAKKEVTSKAPEAAAMLENITDSTTGMMDAMNDIVWMINTKNDRFDNIVDRMNAFANELLEAKNCNVHLHVTPELQKLRLDMAQRKNLYLIFKEAINNAAKYADCRNVWIDLSMNGSHKIKMTIRDDGKGFDANVSSRGNGLLSMQKRATELEGEFELNSKVGEGTMVKLEFGL